MDFTQRLSRLTTFERRKLQNVLARAQPAVKQESDPVYHEKTSPLEIVALSPQQEQLAFVDKIGSGKARNSLCLEVFIVGSLDITRFEQAVRHVVSRHEILTLSIKTRNGQPEGALTPELDFEIPYYDLSDFARDDAENSRKELLTSVIRREFDLSQPPLFFASLVRMHKDRHVFHWVVHHVVWDGVSHELFVKDLISAYETGECKPGAQYQDFAKATRTNVEDTKDALGEYWKEKLAGLPPTEFVSDFARGPTIEQTGSLITRKMNASLRSNFLEFSRTNRATHFSVLLAALWALIYRLTENTTPVIGTPVDCRDEEDWQELIGYFVTLVPIKGDLQGEESFLELVGVARQAALDAMAHKDLPFNEIVRAVNPQRDPSRLPLIQIELTVEYRSAASRKMGDCSVEYVPVHDGGARFDVSFIVQVQEDTVEISAEYNSALFEAATVELLLSQYIWIITYALDNPESKIASIPLLSVEKRQDLLARGKGNEIPLEANTICELFTRQAESIPDKIAIRCNSRAETYRTLLAKVQQIAIALKNAGVRTSDRIGVSLERSPDMIACLLGILQSGSVYVPLDLSQPISRLRSIIEEVEPLFVVVDDTTRKQMDHLSVPLRSVDSLLGSRHMDEEVLDAGCMPTADGPAYILFTSGSSGRPKGVVIRHRSIVNFVNSINSIYKINRSDRVLAFATIGFDVSVQEIFSPLAAGATIVLADDSVRKDPVPKLADLMIEERITVAELPPSLMPYMQAGSLGSLRLVSVGGEAFPPSLVQAWAQDGRRFFNGYGPTETTVAVVVGELKPDGNKRPAMGLPIANHRVYLLDSKMELVPPGVAGELYVAGIGLASGYFGQDDLTAKSFLPNPFFEPGYEYVYRTGDLARWRPDGRLEYIGRADSQVQVRGFRVELGDIEATLCSYPDVKQAVCLLLTDSIGNPTLIGYYTASEGSDLEAVLLGFLRDRLPNYMVPARLCRLPAIPLSTNGKIDRRALPHPSNFPHAESAKQSVASDDPITKAVGDITFRDVLSLDQIAHDANFFDLGGTSLQAMTAVSRLRAATGAEISLTTFFTDPTIAGIAEAIRRAGGQVVPADERDPLSVLLSGNEFEPASGTEEVVIPPKLKRLWDRSQHRPSDATSNIAICLSLTGKLNLDALKEAVQHVLKTHPVLCARLSKRNADIVLSLNDATAAKLASFDREEARTFPSSQIADLVSKEATRPFDLGAEPLARFRLWRTAEDGHILCIVVHHIVFDGWSIGVLLDELAWAYNRLNADPFSSLRRSPQISFLDWLAAYNNWRSAGGGDALIVQRASILKEIDSKPILRAPLENHRDAKPVRIHFHIDQHRSNRLREIGRDENVTLYILLLTCLARSMLALVGERELVVASPVASRGRSSLQQSIGFYANLVPVPIDLQGKSSMPNLLGHIRATVLSSLDNSDLPVEECLAALAAQGVKPPYRVLFALQDTPSSKNGLDGLRSDRYRGHLEGPVLPIRDFYSPENHQIDIALAMEQHGEIINGLWEFATNAPEDQQIVLGAFDKAVSDLIQEASSESRQLQEAVL